MGKSGKKAPGGGRRANLKGMEKTNKGLDRARKRELAEGRARRNKKQWQSDFEKFELQVAALGLSIREIRGDGNCMFRAVADQLWGNQHRHDEIRTAACDFMEGEPDDFAPFVEDDKGLDAHLAQMRRDAEWGGHLELQAISRALTVNLVVHQLGSQPWEIRNHSPTARTLHLSYHDGEHYSSVRLQDDDTFEPAKPISLAELRVSKSAAFAALAEGPSGQERMIMSSTGCSDLSKIRRMMAAYADDVDTVIDELITQAAMGEDDEGEEDAAAAASKPTPSGAPPTLPSAAPAPPSLPLGGDTRAVETEFWLCPVCTYRNAASDAACDMCTCPRTADVELIRLPEEAPVAPPPAAAKVAPPPLPPPTLPATAPAPAPSSKEPKSNDLCPCGSKLRYRKCCAKRKKTAAKLAGLSEAHLSNKARKAAAAKEGKDGGKKGGKASAGAGAPDSSDSSDEDAAAGVRTLLI